MPTGLDIAGEQVEKRSDRRIFMLGVGEADDDLSVLVEFERHLGADIDPQRLRIAISDSKIGARRSPAIRFRY